MKLLIITFSFPCLVDGIEVEVYLSSLLFFPLL
jgi:hypothetical protein